MKLINLNYTRDIKCCEESIYLVNHYLTVEHFFRRRYEVLIAIKRSIVKKAIVELDVLKRYVTFFR